MGDGSRVPCTQDATIELNTLAMRWQLTDDQMLMLRQHAERRAYDQVAPSDVRPAWDLHRPPLFPRAVPRPGKGEQGAPPTAGEDAAPTPATPEETFARLLAEQPFDSQKRWYDEYLGMLHKASAIATENVQHRQRIAALEHQILSLTLAEDDIGDVSTPELQRIVGEHLRLVRAILAELRARHAALPEDLQHPL